MDKVFLQIINMSITSCYVIFFVMVVRLLLKKAPRVFSYALWSAVLFRLVCPFSIQSIFSLIPVSTQTVPQQIMCEQTPQIQSGITAIDHMVNNFLPVPAAGDSANPLQILIALGEVIWLSGIAVLIVYSVFTTVKLYIKLKSAKPIKDSVYEIEGLKTPFVFGVIRPKIYLPAALSERERAYIILHEQTHIKRFDYIIKPFAFLVLCIHWFNPFVWVAFFLMSEDMELSCDESVIKRMGSDVKKDYSNSLLSFSAGRRIIGGCPIAFGESNTKGRIMNILNYKKPAFWVVIATVIAVSAICFGLMSDPKKEKFTVEDYANQYIAENIKYYENAEWANFKIIESEITKLQKLAVFDNMLQYPIEIWSIEYRLKPDDISKVMLAGGMNEIDGWITEDSSMGKPMLVFSYQHSEPKYLGNLWSGENDLTTFAGLETALRIFLEGIKLLPCETYKGNHVVVQFPLSTGETCQLFLSQPIVQGDMGIWCVERWMDGNGSVYHAAPQTNAMIADYYNDLQKQNSDGHKPSLLDPLQVALDYINNNLGQRVSHDELAPQYSATVEDFLKTPESYFIGYISDFETDKFSKPSFHLDQIEWLTVNDTKRLNELNINTDELTNGYYIHNPNSYTMFCQVTNQTRYNIINRGEDISLKSVSMGEFIKYLEQFSEFAPPFRVVTKDGYVQSITEQYVP